MRRPSARLSWALLPLLGVSLAVPADGVAPAAPAPAVIETTEPRDCLEPAPAAVAVPIGTTVDLRVLVLLDGVDEGRARAVMNRAATSYDAVDIRLVSSFRRVALTGDTPSPDGAPTGNDDLLFDQVKALFPGEVRPPGVDLVYLLTDKDIFTSAQVDDDGSAPESSRNYAVAGVADCIGGVRYPEHAFAIGEQFRSEDIGVGPVRFYVDVTAKIAAHEIGHLMGGHHHYANCAEGAPTEPAEGTACTLMFNFIDTQSLNFSQLNAAVVRGHAELRRP